MLPTAGYAGEADGPVKKSNGIDARHVDPCSSPMVLFETATHIFGVELLGNSVGTKSSSEGVGIEEERGHASDGNARASWRLLVHQSGLFFFSENMTQELAFGAPDVFFLFVCWYR